MADLMKFYDFVQRKGLMDRWNPMHIKKYPESVKERMIVYWKYKILNPELSSFNTFLKNYNDVNGDLNKYKFEIVIFDTVNSNIMPPIEVIVDLSDTFYYSKLLDTLQVPEITTLKGESIENFNRNELDRHDRFFCYNKTGSITIPSKYKSNNERYIQIFYNNLLKTFNDVLAEYLSLIDADSIQRNIEEALFHKNIYDLFLNVLKNNDIYDGIPNMNHSENHFLEFGKNCMERETELYSNIKRYFLRVVLPKIIIVFYDMKNKYNKFVYYHQNLKLHKGSELEIAPEIKKAFWLHFLAELNVIETGINIKDILLGNFVDPDRETFLNFSKRVNQLNDAFLEEIEEEIKSLGIKMTMGEVTGDSIYKDIKMPYYYININPNNYNPNVMSKQYIVSNMLLRPNLNARNLYSETKNLLKKYGIYDTVKKFADGLKKNEKLIVVLLDERNKNNIIRVDPSSNNILFKNNLITLKMPNKCSYEIDPHTNVWRYVGSDDRVLKEGVSVSEYIKNYSNNGNNKNVHFFV